ncbi:hypothetical protein UFOVP569_39 [uncultured Caudovirales phage]|uniref:Uncharacterized protein n=1 Tax=uncultured Caudovirales phage TaxID=2100421 RepID=A0A6J5S3D5_9CAUD|nr:hypothetical protein UFOVP569_39 [uncultured Caudovirales phage]CAB4182675.1 hypothetical protein UFOVP1093_12 [uncultured Caudovirales phage]CAB4199764.1 hypothetical protein UFOVP1340_11 [uncultured Caudovirales phage]CAB4213405.1 hypothetical protein UFOVP1448_12 [uncultured Caudovirales phage]CAB4218813.1 hypothetical protein UFOVP1600_38 [uncultured Caudovirales phage]
MFKPKLVLLPVSVDNWNASRTEYYTTYETEYDTKPLITILTEAALMLNESGWCWDWATGAGILTTVFEHHASYVEEPFASQDIHDFLDRLIDVNSELHSGCIKRDEWIGVFTAVMDIWLTDMFEGLD